MFPHELAVVRIDTVEPAVVTGEIDSVRRRGGRQAYGAVGIESPAMRSTVGVQGDEFVGIVKGEENRLADDDGFKDLVVGHQVVIQRIVPDLLPRAVRTCPLQFQLVRQIVG